MRTIQSKITLTFILLSLAITAILSVVLSLELERTFFVRLTAQLETQSRTVESLLQGLPEGPDGRARGESLLHALSLTTSSRITLITADGTVAYDSWIPDSLLKSLENHVSRPEVMQARVHKIGWDRRSSKSTGENLFYLARMVHLDAKAVDAFSDAAFIRIALSLRDVDDAINEIRLKAGLVGAFVLMIGVIASRLLARQIAKPIVAIGEIIRRIQEGDLDQKLPVHSKDEIGQLSTLINSMTEKLKADIEQLKKLERVRSEFLGNVSHELRTPIFSLKGFLETLLDGAVNDPAVNKKFIERAYNHANRLDTLLTDLIEISRIESGDMKMSFRYFDVVPFLKQIVHDISDQCTANKQELTLDAPDKELLALGDRERLKLAVGNIVDNASKYSPTGSHIRLRVSEQSDVVSISVTDDGPGIEPEHLPRIFERFYRVDKTRSREVGGTGLGLAIVKHIVEAHGGKVSVKSDVGKGTTFSFELRK